MKKKLFWLVALFAALALTFSACPGGGDDDDPNKKPDPNGGGPVDFDLTEIFSATKSGPSAIITLTKTTMSATKGSNAEMDVDLLTKDGGYNISAYKGIKFDYKTTDQANCGLQDSGEPNTMWLIMGWGALTESEWTTVECIFADNLEKAWGNSTAFDKSKFEKLWFGLGNGVNNSSKIEIRNFTFIK
jgi:hypothetical protein